MAHVRDNYIKRHFSISARNCRVIFDVFGQNLDTDMTNDRPIQPGIGNLGSRDQFAPPPFLHYLGSHSRE